MKKTITKVTSTKPSKNTRKKKEGKKSANPGACTLTQILKGAQD